MTPKTIQPYETFVAKDGRRVILRSIRWEDLDDCKDLINSLVEEGADILRDTKVSREEEAEWLGKRLARIDKGEVIDVVAEVNDKMIANSDVEKRSGPMSHVGYFGIIIKKGYRGIGIGTKIMQTLIDKSKKAGLKYSSWMSMTPTKQPRAYTKNWVSKRLVEFQRASTKKANTLT